MRIDSVRSVAVLLLCGSCVLFALVSTEHFLAVSSNSSRAGLCNDEINTLSLEAADRLSVRARRLILNGCFNQALSDINAAIRLRKSDGQLYSIRGFVYLNMGRFQNALKDFSSSTKLHFVTAEVLSGEALARAGLKDFMAGKSLANRAIHMEPSLVFGHLANSFCCLGLNKSDEAFASANEALRINPQLSDGYYARSLAHLQLNHHDHSLRDACKAIQLNQMHKDAHILKSYILNCTDHSESALEESLFALAIDAESLPAIRNRDLARRILELGKVRQQFVQERRTP